MESDPHKKADIVVKQNDFITRRTFMKVSSLALGALSIPMFPAYGNTVRPRQKKSFRYRFLFCNDTHVTSEADARHFRRFIDDANKVPNLFEFVVVCGDLGNKGTEAELALSKRELERLKKPFYTVIGNHDVLRNKDKSPYRKTFGRNRENYVVKHKGTGLIFLDLTDGHKSNVTVSQKTVDWLKSTLGKLDKELPLLVFSHFPLHKGSPMYTAADAEKLFELLDSHTVLGYFSGHWHGRWKGDRNGVDFYCNACMSNSRNNFKWGPSWYKKEFEDMKEGFLVVEVSENGVGTSFLEYGRVPAVK